MKQTSTLDELTRRHEFWGDAQPPPADQLRKWAGAPLQWQVDAIERLWGVRISKSTVRNMHERISQSPTTTRSNT